ncbi:MAG: MAPEG family protein [Leptolyngbya sp. IPPAS B-1204]|nr:MAPEG family protein [Elainella sp. C42_A2020_010]RNJ69513.1 MAG: MAPEG family protein [Leptolyngbya sp. IPPAS B-1204]
MQLPTSALLLYGIVAAAVLVYVPFLVVVYGRVKAGYDIAAPRALFDKLPAYAQRATWAHQNSFESFSLFTAAALMAHVTQVDGPSATGAVLAYLSARLLYSSFYILNLPILRSLMFGVGSASIAVLMISSLMQLS